MRPIIQCFFLFLIGSIAVAEENSPPEKPLCVRLSGQGQRYGSQFEFVIVMFGPDRYYMKCWNGKPGDPSGFFLMNLVIGDRIGSNSHKWSDTGVRGGGGPINPTGGKSAPFPARRLWFGNTFVGAVANDLKVRNDEQRYIEEFLYIKRYGAFQFPSKITWQVIGSSMPNEITTYDIEKVEYPKDVDKKWFETIKAEYLEKQAPSPAEK